MTLPDLARLRELLGKATPAPWETLYPIDKHTEEMEWYLTPLDAQLAIELRNSAPALLDAAERCAELERVLGDLEWIVDHELDYQFCPACDATRRDGHTADCELRAALRPSKEAT